MNDSKSINLDLSKLYGYKIVEDEVKEKCIASKIGGGGKVPPAPATILPAKIGLGKVGVKVR
jgi:hypothetical protein